MQDDYGKQFNMPPGSSNPGETSPEQLEKANEWEKNMENVGFSGETKQFGTANETNEYYGETTGVQQEAGEEFNKGISDAAALVNYGLDAAARERGVEFVVQTVRNFYGTTVKELFDALGIDTPVEYADAKDEEDAAKAKMAEFRGSVNAPSQKATPEGFTKAIQDMKELILEVEGADPRYEELRAGARAAGKGYFEYAVSSFGTRGLTELFQVLSAQREKSEAEAEKPVEDPFNVEKVENAENTEEPETLNPEIINRDAAA